MIQPPKWARLLVQWSVNVEERRFVLADLEEEFHERWETDGRRAAVRWYAAQALRTVSPSIARRLRQRAVLDRAGRLGSVSGIAADLRYSVRRIISTPIYSSVVLLTVALGIGAQAIVFAVVDAVLIESLPFGDPDQLVQVREVDTRAGGSRSRVSPPNFLDWREDAQAFIEVAAVSPGDFVLGLGDGNVRVRGVAVSAGFFGLLQASPGQGRYFLPQDEDVGAAPVAIVSQGFWDSRFGGGRLAEHFITLDDRDYLIVGVLPGDFRYLSPVDVWVPLTFGPDDRSDALRGARYLDVIGRVSSGSIPLAAERFAELARGMEVHPNNEGWTVALTPLRESVVREVRPILLLLFGAVGFVLLIVCVNLATLVLSRTTGAWREIALRRALGATPIELFRQTWMEHTILTIAGAFVGAMVAAVSLNSVLALIPSPLPPHADVAINGRTVTLAFGLALVAATFLSASSMFIVLRSTPSQFLRSAMTAGHGRAVMVMRNGLIAVEIALSVILLIGAGLMVQSFVRLRGVDVGVSPENVFISHVSLPGARYDTPERKADFAARFTAELALQGGVLAAAVTTNLPMSGSNMNFGYHIDELPPGAGDRLTAQYHAVSAAYFGAVGMPFRFGGTFDSTATPGPMVIINERLAQRYWGSDDPVGRSVTVVSQNGPVSRRIVGVVADSRHAGPASDVLEEVYVPFSQDPWSFFTVVLLADEAAPVSEISHAIATSLLTHDPSLPASVAVALSDVVARWSAPARFQMTMVGVFAGLALVLAAVGIYGVIAYFVGTRTREIGVRMAVGAAKVDVLGLVVVRSLSIAAGGLLTGLVGSVVLGRVLTVFLFEVHPYDVRTYVLVSALMLAVTALASYLPARHASRIDPVDALRTS